MCRRTGYRRRRGDRASSQERRHAQLRRRGRAAELRLPRQHDVRAGASDRAALFAARQIRRQGIPEGDSRSGGKLDRCPRQDVLHLQASQRRQVPRRLAADVCGRQGKLRPHHQPARGRGVDPQGLLRGSHRRDARSDHGRLQAEEPDGGRDGGPGLAVQLHLQRRQAQAEPALSGNGDHGLGRLHVRRPRQGLDLGRQALRRLLQQGAALSRRLQDLLRQVGSGRARHPGRTVRRRVPRPQPGRAEAASRQGQGQSSSRSRARG